MDDVVPKELGRCRFVHCHPLDAERRGVEEDGEDVGELNEGGLLIEDEAAESVGVAKKGLVLPQVCATAAPHSEVL